jgi:small subunit ribosomal protein S1
MANKPQTMEDLLKENLSDFLRTGDVLEGTIISIKKNELWVDLGARGVGVVFIREINHVGELKIGQVITVSVVDPELDEGHALLSMKKAVKDRGWDELQRLYDQKEIVEIVPFDANRGGLLVELEGIRGFLPVSQLAAGHYPRVGSSDKDEILHKLNSLVNQPIRALILDINRRDSKLIFSEKEALKGDMQSRFDELKIGDVVEGFVTGVIDFGAFINVDGIEGLIHISEISWERVDNPKNYLKIGEKVKAKIIAIDKDRLSLSLKQMTEDPWLAEVKKFKKGDSLEGKVTRITPFGAFVQISPSVEALVHVSEMSDEEDFDPEKLFQVNEMKQFKVLEVDLENRKIALSLKDTKSTKKKTSTSK